MPTEHGTKKHTRENEDLPKYKRFEAFAVRQTSTGQQVNTRCGVNGFYNKYCYSATGI
jgi:hypothetical protein